jgi:hypothetical protein
MVSVVVLVCLFTSTACNDNTYVQKLETRLEGNTPTVESCGDLVAQLYDLTTLKENEFIQFECVNEDNV